jgi:hypothetical protein
MEPTFCLTKTDLHFVLSRCPIDVRDLLKKYPGKLMLAGGFIRATIAGETVSDIDLLGDNAEVLLQIAKDLTLSRGGRYFTTKNAATVLAHPRIPVQFITRWVFDDPIKCISSFDFTICQAAIWSDGITFMSATSDSFYPDLAARRLTYTSPVRTEDVGGSLLRVIKFVKRGYNIQAGSLAGIVARLLQGVDTSKIRRGDENEEQWTARVITGLLREVDPLVVVDGVDIIDEHEAVNMEVNDANENTAG